MTKNHGNTQVSTLNWVKVLQKEFVIQKFFNIMYLTLFWISSSKFARRDLAFHFEEPKWLHGFYRYLRFFAQTFVLLS